MLKSTWLPEKVIRLPVTLPVCTTPAIDAVIPAPLPEMVICTVFEALLHLWKTWVRPVVPADPFVFAAESCLAKVAAWGLSHVHFLRANSPSSCVAAVHFRTDKAIPSRRPLVPNVALQAGHLHSVAEYNASASQRHAGSCVEQVSAARVHLNSYDVIDVDG